MYIYSNSQFIKDSEATISPFDHGFLYGLGVFETFRIYKGFPFLLYDHLARLQQAVDELGILYRIDYEEMYEMIQELLKINNCQNEDVTVRLNISAGIGEVGKLLQDYHKPTIMCFIRKAPQVNMIEKEAAILNLRRNTPEGKERLKSHHYLNNILGKRELQATPNLEGIFLTEKGYVAEGIVSNIFWVKEGIVYTPSLETGILNGITRQFITKCLERLEIPLCEGFYDKEHLFGSTEVILTNSSQEIVPVKKIHEQYFQGNDGEYSKKLTELYLHYKTKLLSIHEL
ncbi:MULTISPECIES: aminodeoxychorismate lyase [Bacillaceae]|uniref:aminodeoxychorismate lyase n=1 Tax=Bacillaceae TaxID=186817 RepID=UPI000BFC8233|nr:MULTISPECIES: aminodeoxychorismate lyase [Bacillaceae]PGT90930.1 4-amino-4-deoxychorismate lyase [Bacillus sp. AFS040349]UGB31085.1 aminodeoxychorismate lyase [Metabacillus sp. B2-18]